MIVNSRQPNSRYYKEYPCYSLNYRASKHHELQYQKIFKVQFQGSLPPKQLPTFYIDKFQLPQQMYWFQWQTELITLRDIQDIQSQRQISSKPNKNLNKYKQQEIKSLEKRQMKCLYVSKLEKKPHFKVVFNYDPNYIAMCQGYLYAFGQNQLIITCLEPQSDTSMVQEKRKIQINHTLQNASIMSIDFIYSQLEQAICSVNYFHVKKGFFNRKYSKNQSSNKVLSFVDKMFGFTENFKQNKIPPLHFETLVPNILGLVLLNQSQICLINLTTMELIENTRYQLDGWTVDQNKQFIVKGRANKPHFHYGFNDCLLISVGQGSKIQIFLYHIKYMQNSLMRVDRIVQDSQPINMFCNAQIIDFQRCKLRHDIVLNLENISILKSYELTTDGIAYLGLSSNLSQIPSSGYILFSQPQVTHQILTQQHRIWRQHKLDLIEYNNFSNERLLIPGRYEAQFIVRQLKIDNIKHLHRVNVTQDLRRKLILEWRLDYKFITFVNYRNQLYTVRKNSVGKMATINQEQFFDEYDQFAEEQINNNQILSLKFSVSQEPMAIELENDDPLRNQAFDENAYKKSKYIGKYRMCRFFDDKKSIIDNDKFWSNSLNGLYPQSNSRGFNIVQRKANHSNYQEKRKMLTKYSEKFKPLTRPREKEQFQSRKKILSLRVKDKISSLLSTLKFCFYDYQMENLQKNGLVRANIDSSKHNYFIAILQFFDNISHKWFLEEQYGVFGQDLIDQMIDEYMNKFCEYNMSEKIQHDVSNVLHMLFKGLIVSMQCNDPDQDIFGNDDRLDQMYIISKIKEINHKNNPFLMLLNRLISASINQTENNNFLQSILLQLFEDLLIGQKSYNIKDKIPITKSLIYSILNLPIDIADIKQIVASFLENSQFRQLLLIVQAQNNQYYMQLNEYMSQAQQFDELSCVHLSHDKLCLVQQLILFNSDLFGLSQQNQTEMTKYLFRNIQFNALLYKQSGITPLEKLSFHLNRQLIYNLYKTLRKDANIVEKIFQKYYNRTFTYHQNHRRNTSSEIYPDVIGGRHKLSLQQLKYISKLYDKYQKQFKQTKNLKQALHLQYAMIKIHVFRFNEACNSILLQDSQQYVRIIQECLYMIKQSCQNFKHKYPQLFKQENGSIYSQSLSQEQFIKVLNKIWSIEVNEQQNERYSSEWKLYNKPISEKWINLLELTFKQNDGSKFKNYDNIDSVLMCILKEIANTKNKELVIELQSLFGSYKLKQIISKSQKLKEAFNNEGSILGELVANRQILQE